MFMKKNMNNHNQCPECGAPTDGVQEGELCDICADKKRFEKSNNWHNDYIGRTNGTT